MKYLLTLLLLCGSLFASETAHETADRIKKEDAARREQYQKANDKQRQEFYQAEQNTRDFRAFQKLVIEVQKLKLNEASKPTNKAPATSNGKVSNGKKK